MTPLLLLALAQPAGFETRFAGGKPPAVGPGFTLGPDVIAVRRVERPRPPWPAGPHLILTTGDRFTATVVDGDGKVVRVVTPFTGGNAADRLAVPLSSLAAVWLAPPPPDTPADVSRYPWADGPKRTDAVRLRTGDVRRGVVESVTPAGVRLSKAGLLPAGDVLAVAFDPSLSKPRPVGGRHLRVVLADGSRLTLLNATTEGGLRGKIAAGPDVRISLDQVVAVDVAGGPAVDLSDLKPVRQAVEGYTGLTWPWAADRSVKGRPLAVGSDTFDKGLGTHPRTVLTYPLGGKYRRFEAAVGPDPNTGGGVTACRVLVDGQDRTPPGLHALSVPTAVGIDLIGAKELTLEVGFGPFGDVRADVNWGNPRLIE